MADLLTCKSLHARLAASDHTWQLQLEHYPPTQIVQKTQSHWFFYEEIPNWTKRRSCLLKQNVRNSDTWTCKKNLPWSKQTSVDFVKRWIVLTRSFSFLHWLRRTCLSPLTSHTTMTLTINNYKLLATTHNNLLLSSLACWWKIMAKFVGNSFESIHCGLL